MQFLTRLLLFVSLFVYMDVSLGHLGVCRDMASCKRSLTLRPSSLGWASRCPMFRGDVGLSTLLGWVPFFSSFFALSIHYLLVCYMHVFSELGPT